jgi:hypothetical protein
LDLDRDLATVRPLGAVHLSDRGGSRGLVVEVVELATPPRPELLGEDLVHGAGRHRRGGVLELRERRAVGSRELLGEGRLEDRQRLAELHRTALELAEDAEQLVGGASLQLGCHRLGGLAAQALAETEGGAAGDAERQPGEPGGAGDGVARKIVHEFIVRLGTKDLVVPGSYLAVISLRSPADDLACRPPRLACSGCRMPEAGMPLPPP